MRILIDECVDPRVKQLFGDHTTATVHERGWDSLEDGPLLLLAQREFDVLVTIDGGPEHQQNPAKFQIGVVVVQLPKNQIAYYHVVQKELLTAIEKARAGAALHVRTPPA